MKVPEEKIEKLVSDNPLRGPLVHTFLDDCPRLSDGMGKLVSTNGKGLVAIPVELDPDDTPGLIPVDAIKAARKREAVSHRLVCNGDVSIPETGVKYQRPEDQYPDYKAVTPKRSGQITFDLDAKLLEKICSALKTGPRDEITRLMFTVKGPGDPIRIDTDSGAYAVIMPLIK